MGGAAKEVHALSAGGPTRQNAAHTRHTSTPPPSTHTPVPPLAGAQEQYRKDLTLKEAEVLALSTLKQVMEEKVRRDKESKHACFPIPRVDKGNRRCCIGWRTRKNGRCAHQ